MDDSSGRVASPNLILLTGTEVTELTDSSSKNFTTVYRLPTKRGEKITNLNCVLPIASLYLLYCYTVISKLP